MSINTTDIKRCLLFSPRLTSRNVTRRLVTCQSWPWWDCFISACIDFLEFDNKSIYTEVFKVNQCEKLVNSLENPWQIFWMKAQKIRNRILKDVPVKYLLHDFPFRPSASYLQWTSFLVLDSLLWAQPAGRRDVPRLTAISDSRWLHGPLQLWTVLSRASQQCQQERNGRNDKETHR